MVQDPANGSIILAQNSAFQIALATAAASSDPRTATVTEAKKFIASNDFISSVSGTDFQKQVNILSATFDKLEAAGLLNLDAVLAAAKQAFGKEAAVVVASPDFVALRAGLKDSITAVKYVQVRFAERN